MRTYEDLSGTEQAEARSLALNDLLQAVCEGAIRFDDEKNGDDLQARIDAAAARMEELHTPWFMAEALMEDDQVKDHLKGMAGCDAEDAFYADRYERVVRLPVAPA